MQLIDLHAQQQRLQPRLNDRIDKVLRRGDFIMGKEVKELEHSLSAYTSTKHCITCANGTDALQISLMSLGIGQGDVVYTTAFSFVATAEIIALVGATPYFVDIDARTFNMCPESLSSAINRTTPQNGRPKAVITVDLFGQPADYTAIETICKQHSLLLVEDSAQGFGGRIKTQVAGSFGDIATTSFFPAKPLGCYGDGGAIFTNDDRLAEYCRSIRVHGKGAHKYENIRIGLNSRLDTIQAAILLEKLHIFDDECDARNANAAFFAQHLSNEYQLPTIKEGHYSSWAQFSIMHKSVDRKDVISALEGVGVPSAIYYPIPLNEQIAFAGCLTVPTPNAQYNSERVFSIPVHPYLTAKDKDLIVETLNGITT